MSEVLLVSPENTDADELVSSLTSLHIDCRHITKGREAIIYIKSMDISLVIVDEALEDLSALELLTQIMEDANSDSPPFVLMGELGSSKTAGKAMGAGAVDFLPRPLDRQEACAIVMRWMRHSDTDNEPGEDEDVCFEAEQGVLILRVPENFGYHAAMSVTTVASGGFSPPEKGVVVDLSQCNYISSTGIGALHLLAEACKGIEGRLYIAAPSVRLRHLLELAGINHYYNSADTVDDALAILSNTDSQAV